MAPATRASGDPPKILGESAAEETRQWYEDCGRIISIVAAADRRLARHLRVALEGVTHQIGPTSPAYATPAAHGGAANMGGREGGGR